MIRTGGGPSLIHLLMFSKGPYVTTWEYVTTPLMIHNTAAILNSWGAQGFELVQIVQGPEGGLVAYLKRPTQDA